MDASANTSRIYPGKLPAIAIRDVVLFPHMALPLSVDRPKSVAAIETALPAGKLMLALAQKKPAVNDPAPEDLYAYGVVSEVAQSLKMPDGTMRVFLEGHKRARVLKLEVDKERSCLMAEVEYVDDSTEKTPEIIALMRHAVQIFEEYVKLGTRITLDSVALLAQIEDPSKLADTIAANSIFNVSDRQEILETAEVKVRLERIM